MRKKREKSSSKNKIKKNSTKFFSNLNASSNIEYGYDETNVKSKRFKWIFGSLVLAVLATGIAVPWSLSSCTAQIKKPLSGKTDVITYQNGKGEKVTITLENWLKQVESIKFNSSILKKQQDLFNSSIIEQLYNEERAAYLKFKAYYNATHKESLPTSFGYDLSKSAKDIQNEQQKILNNNKKSFQRSMGNGWLEAWLKELQSNSLYGPQNSDINATTNDIPQMEKKAVEYMKVQSIKQPALARFESASINTKTWIASDLTINNPNEIKYTDEKDEEQMLSPNTANDFFKQFLTSSNTMRPKNISSSNQNLLAVFETKSYIPEYRVPNQMMTNVLTKFYKSSTISSFDIPIIKPGASNSSPFTFDATILTRLFTISTLRNNNAVVEKFIPFNQISSFKGVANVLNINNPNYSENVVKDSNLIKLISGSESNDEISNTLGSSKNKSLGEIVATSGKSREDDSSQSTDKSKNFFLAALGINGKSFTNDSNEEKNYELYKAKEFNPFNAFIDLLFSIPDNQNKPNFANYQWMEENWKTLGSAQTQVSEKLLAFIKHLKENLDLDNKKQLSFKGSNFQSFNEKLSNIVTTNLEANDFNYLGLLFNLVLTDENAKTSNVANIDDLSKLGYWNLYKLNDDTYMYLSDAGIKIFSILVNTNLSNNTNHINEMIVGDLYQTVNGESENSNLYFDMPSFYSKLNNEYIYTSILLNDNDLVSRFKFKISNDLGIEIKNSNGQIIDNFDQLDPNWLNNLDANNKDKINNEYNQFVKQITIKISSELTTNNEQSIQGIDAILSDFANSRRTYDFALNQENGIDQIYFQTPTEYGNNSPIKGLNDIQETFLQRIWNIVSVDMKNIITVKGGK